MGMSRLQENYQQLLLHFGPEVKEVAEKIHSIYCSGVGGNANALAELDSYKKTLDIDNPEALIVLSKFLGLVEQVLSSQ